jgi:uncharacterized protein YbcI
MARIHSDSYGLANRVRTIVCEDLVISLVDIELLPSEEVLVAAGRQELVETTHNEFEHSIRASFKAAVERATGRTVVSFMSKTHLNPHVTIELFMLNAHSDN